MTAEAIGAASLPAGFLGARRTGDADFSTYRGAWLGEAVRRPIEVWGQVTHAA